LPLDRFARLSELVELGFEPAPPDPVTTETIFVEGTGLRLTQARPAMGTVVSLTCIHESAWLIEETFGRAYEEMDRLIDLLNRYDDRSALGVLNQEGHLAGPPPALEHVLAGAGRIHSLTGGRFDVTVAPIVDLMRRRFSHEVADRDAADPEMRTALERVGFEHVDLMPARVELGRPDMSLTLDGIAKGYIVDAMATILRAHGLADWLINAGGDIRTAGAPGPGLSWQVAVRDPSGDGVLPGTVSMQDGAVATSGGYESFYDADRTLHHIVDGRTGRSPACSLGASVMAPDALTADALATSLFLMDPIDGLRLIDALPGHECLLVALDGSVLTSAGWTFHPTPLEDGN